MWRACDGGGGRKTEGKMNCNRNNIIEFYKYNVKNIYAHSYTTVPLMLLLELPQKR